MPGVDRGPRQEKKQPFVTWNLDGINILFFLKNCYWWLKLITCSYTSREYTAEKKITMYKKDN